MNRQQAEALSGTTETRYLSSLEARSVGGRLQFNGIASVTGVWYDMGDGSREQIQPGAFRSVLSTGPDVVFNVQHGAGSLPLARTTNGSLTLSETGNGLEFHAMCDPSDAQAADAHDRVTRGLLTQCSFQFGGAESRWANDHADRTITKIGLLRDVSVVDFGASPTTTIQALSARALLAARDGLAPQGSVSVGIDRRTYEIYARANLLLLSGRHISQVEYQRRMDKLGPKPQADRADLLTHQARALTSRLRAR